MRFEEFARAHGLIIRNVVQNRWVQTPTEDHPKSGNGRYKFIGHVGWVQNWATMDKPSTWFDENTKVDSKERFRQMQNKDNQQAELAEKAAKKAGWIMHQTVLEEHPYLKAKGFDTEKGNVWHKNGEALLVIPLRINGNIVGVQLINSNGEKKFLYGQTTKGATFTIDAKGFPIFCEGYATGLAIRNALKFSNIKYCIHVCFSASNMKLIARNVRDGIIVADNDPNHIGEITAWEANKPYWISPTVGDDFNDFWKRVGTAQASASLRKVVDRFVM